MRKSSLPSRTAGFALAALLSLAWLRAHQAEAASSVTNFDYQHRLKLSCTSHVDYCYVDDTVTYEATITCWTNDDRSIVVEGLSIHLKEPSVVADYATCTGMGPLYADVIATDVGYDKVSAWAEAEVSVREPDSEVWTTETFFTADVMLTVLEITNIVFCRMDEYGGPSDPDFAAEVDVPVGAITNDHHKVKGKGYLDPPVAGITIKGKLDYEMTSTTDPSGDWDVGGTTDASGRFFGETLSGTQTGEVHVVITQCHTSAMSYTSPDSVKQLWDIDPPGTYDFECPDYFAPGVADDVKCFPTVEAMEAEGCLAGHSMAFGTCSITVYRYEYDLDTGSYTVGPGDVTAVDDDSFADLPFSLSIGDLVTHTTTTEPSSGKYENQQTVFDWWEYDAASDVLRVVEPQQYGFVITDTSVDP